LAVPIGTSDGVFAIIRDTHDGAFDRGTTFMIRDSDANCERIAVRFEACVQNVGKSESGEEEQRNNDDDQ